MRVYWLCTDTSTETVKNKLNLTTGRREFKKENFNQKFNLPQRTERLELNGKFNFGKINQGPSLGFYSSFTVDICQQGQKKPKFVE